MRLAAAECSLLLGCEQLIAADSEQMIVQRISAHMDARASIFRPLAAVVGQVEPHELRLGHLLWLTRRHSLLGEQKSQQLWITR